MKFKKIKILGFKSFVDPTELNIEQGLTGIVGPNGCGKSNVVESLRWCRGNIIILNGIYSHCQNKICYFFIFHAGIEFVLRNAE